MKLTNNLYFYPEPGMMDCNTYVVTGNPSIIFDPGSTMFLPVLIDNLRADGLDPGDIDIIVNTHLHGDHCAANEAFKKLSGARIILHPVQKEFYSRVVSEEPGLVGLPIARFSEDACIDGNRLKAGDTEFELIPAPGHSPDCVCYYSSEYKVLICGDVIFNENIGRVDIPGGSGDDLKQSIERLSKLEVEYLLPGHMGILTGADRVKRNFDFVREYIFGWL